MFRQDRRTEQPTEHLSDHGLLALAARGDRNAFAALYRHHCDPAHALALRIVRDRDLAADVVQEVFLAVWSKAPTYDATRGQPSTWILTMTHHKAVDMVRRMQRRQAAPLELAPDPVDPAPAVEEQAWLGATRAQIAAALRRLPDPHREVLELAYFAGYTQSELAERLALPLGTVKSRTFAALGGLRTELAAAGLHPEDEWNTRTS